MNDLTIDQATQLEIWQSIRAEIRRRLTVVITIGFLYLVAALAVGAYLLSMVGEIGRDLVYLDDRWNEQPLGTERLLDYAAGYAVLAIFGLIAYVLILAYVHDRLPAWMCGCMSWIPLIGSTVRMLGVGDFCGSIFRSVIGQRTYGEAFRIASSDISDPRLRRWSMMSATRIDAGQPLSTVLRSVPVDDVPLNAVSTILDRLSASADTDRIWRFAANECHTVVQSRLSRTIQMISGLFLLISLTVATGAMLVSSMFMTTTIEGLSQLW